MLKPQILFAALQISLYARSLYLPQANKSKSGFPATRVKNSFSSVSFPTQDLFY